MYTIYTTKAGSTTATEQATTATSANSPYDVDATAKIENSNYTIVSDFTSHPLPSGYIQEEMEYNTYKVLVGKNSTNNLTIMYLVKEDGTDHGAFYIYDTVNKTFCIMTVIEQPTFSYTVLAIDDSMERPDGFNKSTATMNGNNVDVLIPANIATPNYYLFYGVNSNGVSAWYCYDTVEGTIQRYYAIPDQGIAIDAIGNVQSVVTNQTRMWMMIAIASMVSTVVFLMISIVLAVKKKSYVKEEEEEEDFLDDEEHDDSNETTIESSLEEDDDFEFLEIDDVQDKR